MTWRLKIRISALMLDVEKIFTPCNPCNFCFLSGNKSVVVSQVVGCQQHSIVNSCVLCSICCSFNS